MMDNMESCVPPGFRFHPTDEELVGYYLKKKVASQKIDLDVIRDIDLYRIEPWDLRDICRIGYEEQNEWYFFSHKDKKYPTGTRTNRATIAGFWKATGRDKAVYDKLKLIGMRKTLVFYRGRAPNGQKSDWIMHEYRLESEENGPPQEEGWVVCRAFKKRTMSQTKNKEGWDTDTQTPSLYDNPSIGALSSILDATDNYTTRQSQDILSVNNYSCKKEIEADNLNNLVIQASSSNDYDQFVELPLLESPTLALVKGSNCKYEKVGGSNSKIKKVTDWRDLDKFVASQLSQEDRCNGSEIPEDPHGVSSLLLLQSQRREHEEEEDEILLSNLLMSSSSELCDIGICIFDK